MMPIPTLARWTAVGVALMLLVAGGLTLLRPTPARSQSPDVELNVRPGQMKRINIAVPDFNLVGGTDQQNWAKRLPGITGVDLNFSALFSVASGRRRSSPTCRSRGAPRTGWPTRWCS